MPIDRGAFRWSLFTAWVVASAVGGALAAVVARQLGNAVGGASHPIGGMLAAEAATGAVALGCLLAGIAAAQWIAVRHRLSGASRLIPVNVLAGAAAGAVGLGAWALIGGPGSAGTLAAAAALGLGAFAAVQWLALRRRIARAGWWAAASTAGLVAAVLALGLAGELVGTGAGAGVLYGAAYGAVTGPAAMACFPPRPSTR